MKKCTEIGWKIKEENNLGGRQKRGEAILILLSNIIAKSDVLNNKNKIPV